MTPRNQLQSQNTQKPSSLPDSQFSQLLRQLLQLSQGKSENTGLIVAYLSLLGFLAAGIFGIFGVLILQRFNTESPQLREQLPNAGTINQQEQGGK
jgi:hypothetical protein